MTSTEILYELYRVYAKQHGCVIKPGWYTTKGGKTDENKDFGHGDAGERA